MLDTITNNICTYDVSWFQVLGSEVIVIEDSVEDDTAKTATVAPTQISPKSGDCSKPGNKGIAPKEGRQF